MALLAGMLSTFAKEIGVTVFGALTMSDVIDKLSARKSLLVLEGSKVSRLVSRTAANLTCAVMLTAIHLSLHGQTTIYNWGITENSISLLGNKSERVLSYGHVMSLYIWKMLYPFKLSYDWGW